MTTPPTRPRPPLRDDRRVGQLERELTADPDGREWLRDKVLANATARLRLRAGLTAGREEEGLMTVHAENDEATTIIESELRGCTVAMIATAAPAGDVGYILHLDRAPQTYCRSLTRGEVATLARINPDDGVPDEALNLLCDLALALAVVTGDWEGAIPATKAAREGREMAAIFRPLLDGDLATVGRIAADCIAAQGPAVRR